MKKFSAVFMGIALLVSGFMFSSCEQDDDVKEVLGPNNVWCETRNLKDLFTDTTDLTDDQKDGTCYFKYDDKTKTFTIAYLPKAGGALAKTFDAAVNLGSESGKRGYYQKVYVDGVDSTPSDDDDDETKSKLSSITKMTQGKWETFYIAKLKKSSMPSNAKAIDLNDTAEQVKAIRDSFTLNNLLRILLGLEVNSTN